MAVKMFSVKLVFIINSSISNKYTKVLMWWTPTLYQTWTKYLQVDILYFWVVIHNYFNKQTKVQQPDMFY